MPLLPGKSKAVIKQNFKEFHEGPTYAHTKKKFGSKRANAQAVAVVLQTAGRTIGSIHREMRKK